MQITSVDDVSQNSTHIAMTYINRLIRNNKSLVDQMKYELLPINLNTKDNYLKLFAIYILHDI